MDFREDIIQVAIADLHAGTYASVRAAAKAYGLPKSTLQRYYNGGTTRVISHQHRQRLTPSQEDFLAQWILDEDKRGRPPTRARVREMATRILLMNEDTNKLGKDWIPSFLRQIGRAHV